MHWVKQRHGRRLEGVTSNRKSDSVNRTFRPSFIPTRFETAPLAFSEEVAPTRAGTTTINKMSSDMRSVPDLNIGQYLTKL